MPTLNELKRAADCYAQTFDPELERTNISELQSELDQLEWEWSFRRRAWDDMEHTSTLKELWAVVVYEIMKETTSRIGSQNGWIHQPRAGWSNATNVIRKWLEYSGFEKESLGPRRYQEMLGLLQIGNPQLASWLAARVPTKAHLDEAANSSQD